MVPCGKQRSRRSLLPQPLISLNVSLKLIAGSSFAENFYGLRRRRRPGVSTDRARAASSRSTASYEQLRSREIIGSLIFLVGLPYIQAKAKDYWERIGGGVDDGALFGDEEEHDREQGGPRRPMLRLDEVSRCIRCTTRILAVFRCTTVSEAKASKHRVQRT